MSEHREQLYIETSGISCGVDQIVDIREDFDLRTLINSVNGVHDPDASYSWNQDIEPVIQKGYTYIFSDAVKYGNGRRLAEMVRKYKLGTLISKRPVKNPNTGNKIQVWIWTYNGKKIKLAKTKRKQK